jgi:hypothetical protein
MYKCKSGPPLGKQKQNNIIVAGLSRKMTIHQAKTEGSIA